MTPSRAAPRKLLLSSMVVKFCAPSGRCAICAIAASGVGQPDNGGGVQIAVGGHEFVADGEAARESALLDGSELDAEQAGQKASAARVELIKGQHGSSCSPETQANSGAPTLVSEAYSQVRKRWKIGREGGGPVWV